MGVHNRREAAIQIAQRAGRFRAQLLIQANTRAPLHRLISAWLLVLEQMPSGRQVRWSLDVDPVDLY